MTSTARSGACMALGIPGGAAPAGREEQHGERVPCRLELVFADSAKCTFVEETADEWQLVVFPPPRHAATCSSVVFPPSWRE
jgi:hypothetical protein